MLFTNKVYSYKDLDIYAENGVIHLVSKNLDDKSKPEKVVNANDWKDRLFAMYKLGLGLEGRNEGVYKELKDDTRRALEIMEAVLRDAIEQGNPLDPKVQAEHLNEFRTNKRYTMKPRKIFNA